MKYAATTATKIKPIVFTFIDFSFPNSALETSDRQLSLVLAHD